MHFVGWCFSWGFPQMSERFPPDRSPAAPVHWNPVVFDDRDR